MFLHNPGERLSTPLFCLDTVSLFVFGSTDIVAMGNRTILSSSLALLYRKVFWLVNLLWVGIKQHLENSPPTVSLLLFYCTVSESSRLQFTC